MTKEQSELGHVSVIVGVPRSGTSVLHALACTSARANPYMGEASYFRAMLTPFRHARAVFDQHTRFVFPDIESLRTFHRQLLLEVLQQYRKATAFPKRLVLKDPLLTGAVGELKDLLPEVRIILMLRHPADVIASRIKVQKRAGRKPEASRLIEEHNSMLHAIIETWSFVRPEVITYPMLEGRHLAQVKTALDLDDIDNSKLWSRSLKSYPEDGQQAWVTPLFGKPIELNHRGRFGLAAKVRERIERECLPTCSTILKLAGKRSSAYWKPSDWRPAR